MKSNRALVGQVRREEVAGSEVEEPQVVVAGLDLAGGQAVGRMCAG